MTEADTVFSAADEVGMEGRIVSVVGGAGEESFGLQLRSRLSCMTES